MHKKITVFISILLASFVLGNKTVLASTPYDQTIKDSSHFYTGFPFTSGFEMNSFTVGGFDPSFVLNSVRLYGYFYNPDNLDLKNCHINLNMQFFKNTGHFGFGAGFVYDNSPQYVSEEIQSQNVAGYFTFNADITGAPMSLPAGDLNINHQVQLWLSYNRGGGCNFDANPNTAVVIYETIAANNNIHPWFIPNTGFTPYVALNDSPAVSGKTPILIVPGLLGTDMSKGSDLLWPNISKMALNVGDGFMDPLQFTSNLAPSDGAVAIGEIVGNPDNLFNYSDALIQEFQNQGYTQGTSSEATLFTFPYDWRYGVSGKITDSTTTVELLKAKIEEIRNQTHADKVDIVAHSTGGLVVKEYAMTHPQDNHMGKAVFVGVPNLGAPKAIKVLLTGDNFGIPFLSDAEMQKIAKYIPVAYDLSPSQQYANKNGSFVTTITSQGFGSSTQNLNFSQTDNFLVNDHGFSSQGLANAHTLHSSGLDDFDMRSAGVDLYSIVGCKNPTTGNINEDREATSQGYVVDGYVTNDITGDGTVPMASADSLTLDSNNKFYAIKADHGKMPSANGIRQKIVNIISGSNLDTGSNIISQQSLASNPSQCQLTGHWWQIFSPLSIEVFDQSGNRAGITSDGSIQNDIPGADYEVLGEHKFVFVPTDAGQTYHVNLAGTGTGTFTFKDESINSGSVTQTQVFSNIPVTPALTGQVNLNSAGGQTFLALEATPTSSPVTVQPSSIVNQSQSLDLTPPVSTSTITGTVGQPGFYRSNVGVNFSATDPIVNNDPSQTSGVLKTSYSVDGAGYQIYSTSTPISVTVEGLHTITFFSTDNAGNNELPQTISFTIDKTSPELTMQFNPQVLDLQFSGSDNLSTSTGITVLDQDTVITVTDQAGNNTQLIFKDKNRKKALKAEIQSLSYNNVAQDISKTVLKFNWTLDKLSQIKTLEQHVKTKKEFNIDAVYSGGQTTLSGKDQSGKISKVINGLTVLKVTTNKGDFGWGQ